MKNNGKIYIGAVLIAGAVSGCGSLTPPKYENGMYVPPMARNALQITVEENQCGMSQSNKAVVGAIVGVLAPALINQVYDRFVNWLDAKQANLSASSSGVATAQFYTADNMEVPQGCLKLTRGQSLVAAFSIVPIVGTPYWNMIPYSLDFRESEAKEGISEKKSIVAEISFAVLGGDGKPVTFFQSTFSLGSHKAGDKVAVATGVTPFPGQDSGPVAYPKGPESQGNKLNPYLVMRVSASIIEHGEGRDWIRGVTDSLREKENREKIVQTLIDGIVKGAGK